MSSEFDRRLLEVTQNHMDIVGLMKSVGQNAVVEHFGYTVQIGSETDPLVDGVMRTAMLSLQADSWFVLQYVSSCVVRPASPYWFTDSGNIKLQVTDTGNGDVLFSTPNSAGVLTATVSRPQTGIPMLLPIPRALPPNTNIKIDVTQQGVAADNEEPQGFFLFFGGSRIAQV